MAVPNTFANATTSIPLSQLDQNFATAITLGNTAVQLGNTVTTLNNMTLANVTVSTGNVSFTQGTIGGNVVINTTGTSNTGNLSVTGTITPTGVIYAADGTAANPSYRFNSSASGLFGSGSDFLGFSTAGAERMRISSSGNLLVGTTSASTFYRLQSITTGATASALFQNDDSASQTLTIWNAATSGNNVFSIFTTEANGTTRGSIDYNRAAGQVRYNTTSDGALKNKFGPASIEVSKNIVLSAPISEFAWKDDPEQRPQIGPIAQELHAVFPGAVSVGGMVEREVTDEEGNTTIVEEYQPWGVDKTAFTWHHTVCLQDLYAQIETLKAKIAALEAIK